MPLHTTIREYIWRGILFLSISFLRRFLSFPEPFRYTPLPLEIPPFYLIIHLLFNYYARTYEEM